MPAHMQSYLSRLHNLLSDREPWLSGRSPQDATHKLAHPLRLQKYLNTYNDIKNAFQLMMS